MTYWKKLIVIGCLLALMLPAVGCQDENSMESAGKKMDQMMQDAEDSVNDAISDTKRSLGFHEPGPAEKLLGESGRAVDDFLYEAEKTIDKTVSKTKMFFDDLVNNAAP